MHLLKSVHPCEMCPDCRVIRTSRSKHCAICNKCVERFDHHCPWINNCVGINNHNSFLVFIITLLIVLCLIVASSVFTVIDECHPNSIPNECVMRHICLGCKNLALRYAVLAFTLFVGLFFGGPSIMLCSVHLKNYCSGKTTNERFARKGRTNSVSSEEDSDYSANDEGSTGDKLIKKDVPRRRTKKGCCSNCYAMWCNRKIQT